MAIASISTATERTLYNNVLKGQRAKRARP